MTNEERMSKELKDNNIIDNPFDLLLYESLQLTRDILFASRRLKHPLYTGMTNIVLSSEQLTQKVADILKDYITLEHMSVETIRMCGETSHYYSSEFDDMNKELLKMQGSLETILTRCNPNRNDRFEQIRLGVDSAEYKRILELRDIADNSGDLSQLNKEDLMNMVDVVTRPSDCSNFMSGDEITRAKEIISKYNLTDNDIHYILAYKYQT